jgi:hypothetical protein
VQVRSWRLIRGGDCSGEGRQTGRVCICAPDDVQARTARLLVRDCVSQQRPVRAVQLRPCPPHTNITRILSIQKRECQLCSVRFPFASVILWQWCPRRPASSSLRADSSGRSAGGSAWRQPLLWAKRTMADVRQRQRDTSTKMKDGDLDELVSPLSKATTLSRNVEKQDADWDFMSVSFYAHQVTHTHAESLQAAISLRNQFLPCVGMEFGDLSQICIVLGVANKCRQDLRLRCAALRMRNNRSFVPLVAPLESPRCSKAYACGTRRCIASDRSGNPSAAAEVALECERAKDPPAVDLAKGELRSRRRSPLHNQPSVLFFNGKLLASGDGGTPGKKLSRASASRPPSVPPRNAHVMHVPRSS